MEIFISLSSEAASNPPAYLYHATLANNLKSINKHGLNGAVKKWFGLVTRSNYSISDKGVYLAHTPEFASDFVLDGKDVAVLKIKTSKLNPSLLYDDPNVLHRLPKGMSFVYKGIIKPDAFEVASV